MKKQFKKSRQHQSEVTPQEPKDPSPPKLTLSSADPSAFQTFKDRMYGIANSLYPKMGTLFIENKLPDIAVVNEDSFNLKKESDIARFRDAIKREGDYRASLDLAASKLFTVLLQELSDESIQSVKQALVTQSLEKKHGTDDEDDEGEDNDADSEVSSGHQKITTLWDDFLVTTDVTRLWELIRISHMIKRTGSQLADRNKSISVFESLKMRRNERLEVYMSRWTAAERAVVATGGELRAEEELAVKFISSLDSSRWGHLQVQCFNRGTDPSPSVRRRAYPSSVDAAYLQASQWVTVASEDEHGAPKVTFAGQVKRPPVATSTSATANATTATATPTSTTTVAATATSTTSTPATSGNSTTQSKGKKKKTPDRPCTLCGGAGHWTSQCPHLSRARELIGSEASAHFSFGLSLVSMKRGDILLDSGSEIHIFRDPELLCDISSCKPFTLGGIDGNAERMSVEKCGKFRGIDVYHHPGAGANVLSWALLEDAYTCVYDSDSGTVTVTGDGQHMVFKRHGQHYVLHVAPCTTAVTSVRDNEKLYSRRDVERAKRARRLIESLNYPSSTTLIRALAHGSFDNPGITADDVRRADHIYGTPRPAAMGKATRPHVSPTVPQPHQKPHTQQCVMSIDIMSIDSMLWLVWVLDRVGVTMTAFLPNKSATTILQHVNTAVSLVKRLGWEPSLRCDHEANFIKVINLLASKAEVAAPGTHVPVVERKIRVIKERVRATLHSLPYDVPRFMMKWIVSSVTTTINMLPEDSEFKVQSDFRSPRERLIGKRVDVKLHLSLPFGQYVHLYDVGNPNPSSMRPRTFGAISLGTVGNDAGTHMFWSLASHRIVHRNTWKEIPIPQDIINAINDIAKKTGVADPTLEGEPIPMESAQDPQTAERSGISNRGVQRADDVRQPTSIEDSTSANSDSPTDTPTDPTPTTTDSTPTTTDVPTDATPTTSTTHDDPTTHDSTDNIHSDDPDPGTATSDIPDSTPTTPTATADIPTDTSSTDNGEQRLPTRSNRGVPAERYGFHVRMTDAVQRLGDAAIASIVKELQNIISYDALEPVHRGNIPQHIRPIVSSLFLKEKHTPDGKFEKLKARFVAGGHLQDKTLYSKSETSSPTISLWALFCLSTISAKEGRSIVTVDVQSAYLNASISDKPVYMRVEPALAQVACIIKPEWKRYLDHSGALFVKLRKALYGCVESAALWYKDLRGTIISAGYTASKIDPCVYFKKDKDGKCIHVVTHVDDIKIMSQSEELIQEFLKTLRDKDTHLTINEGKKHNYLGMIFDYEEAGKVAISMDGYVHEILTARNCTSIAKSPATEDLFSIDPSSPRLSKELSDKFHTDVARLLYLVERVRPDMATAVAFLTTRVHVSTEQDLQKLSRLMDYLNHTKHLHLTLEADDAIQVKTFIDASYAVHADYKSHTGGHITLGKGGIVSKSCKQKIVSKSSTEAELVGVSDFISTALQVREFLTEMGYQQRPTILFQDNMSTMTLMDRGRPASERTRHIYIRHFFIKERIDLGEIEVRHCGTDDMVSDILTKPLCGAKLYKLRDKLLNHHSSDQRGVLRANPAAGV